MSDALELTSISQIQGGTVFGSHGNGARRPGSLSPVDARFCPGPAKPMIARTSGSGTWLRAVRCQSRPMSLPRPSSAYVSISDVMNVTHICMCVSIKLPMLHHPVPCCWLTTRSKPAAQVTTGDPVSADPWALAASRGGYDCGAAPRTGCTVTTAYATAPANGGACCDPHAAAPGSPVLVFSPFAARRNAPHQHPHSNAFVNNNNNAIEAASAAAPSYPADRDSLTSDRSAFDDGRGEAMAVQAELQVRFGWPAVLCRIMRRCG